MNLSWLSTSALGNRNFRFLFWGQCISFIGTWLQIVTQGWLAFQITHSVETLGNISFLGVAVIIVLAPIGGVIADSLSTRKIFMATSVLGMIHAVALGILFYTGHLSLSMLYVMAFLWGLIGAFESPARYTGIMEMVEPDNVPSAKALNGMIVNLGFIIGPSIGGFIIATCGVGTAFVVNAASFIPMIIFLRRMRWASRAKPLPGAGKILTATADGIRYCATNREIGSMILTMGIAMFFGFSYRNMIPAIANSFGLGAIGFGILSMLPGIGALLGTAKILSLPKGALVHRMVPMGMLFLGASLSLLSLAKGSLVLSAAAMIIAGFSLELVVIPTQATTGMISMADNPGMTGRVMGCGASVFFLGNALGSVSMGYSSQHFGLFNTIGCAGVLLVGFAMLTFQKNQQ